MMETLLIAAGVPSAMIGFCVWLLERRIQKRDEAEKEERKRRQKEADDRDDRREQFELHLLQSVNATATVAKATARAVQRIPDAHCNGDMTSALEYAEKVEKEQTRFMQKQGVSNLF